MKREEGIVLETDGTIAMVRASKHSECESCGACAGGGASVITARNKIGALAGQSVVIEIQDDQSLKSAFLIFVLPLLALFIGGWLGGLLFAALSYNAAAGRIIGGLVLLAAAIVFIKLIDKKAGGKDASMPSVVKIIG